MNSHFYTTIGFTETEKSEQIVLRHANFGIDNVARNSLYQNSGGVAQMVRACGSYPQCPGFNSLHRHFSDHEGETDDKN